MPPAVTTYTGLDALTHAVEAYTCTATGPLSDVLALRAIELVAKSLRTAVADGNDGEARRDMSLASLLAGAAFTNADVGAVHCLSEVVGGHYDLPHGQICAMYLPASAAFNLEAMPERYAAVAAALGADVAGVPAGARRRGRRRRAQGPAARPRRPHAGRSRRARRRPREHGGALRRDGDALRGPASRRHRPTSSPCSSSRTPAGGPPPADQMAQPYPACFWKYFWW